MNHIYLDANSTTPLDESVRQTILECYELDYANPASQHQPGQRARRVLEVARNSILSHVGANSKSRLLFTCGGTESNNLALLGLSGAMTPTNLTGEPLELIVSDVEHPSVLGAADFLKTRAVLVKRLPVDSNGVARVDLLSKLITPRTQLVSLMLANNETGTIQDVATAASICQDKNVLMHCDAVQSVGKIPVNFSELGVSAMTLTAHKLHGPRGIGALILNEHVEPHPIVFGGSQQLGQRPGTEDVALACGFAKAVELATGSVSSRAKHLEGLRDQFESTILAELPRTVINGKLVDRIPHTSNLSFPGYDDFATVNRQALLMAVDAAGVAISTGSACASGSSEPSHVLAAMGVSNEIVESSIRVSISMHSTEQEITEGARRIINAVNNLRQQKSKRK